MWLASKLKEHVIFRSINHGLLSVRIFKAFYLNFEIMIQKYRNNLIRHGNFLKNAQYNYMSKREINLSHI